MRKKILIADDNQKNRYMLRALLEGHGYDVSEAGNGLQALEHARAERPDAVVTDLLMPQMDGFALCREWVGDKGLNSIPIIVYTATYTDPKDRQLALDIGASDFIVKPADPEELLHAILQVLEKTKPRARESLKLQNEDFYERYSRRLKEKLNQKVAQLATAERSLSEYVTRCEAILDASPSAIISTDGKMKIRAWNFSAECLFGYSESEALGKPLEMLIPVDQREKTHKMLAKVRDRREVIRYETRRLRKDGKTVDVAISLSFLGPEIGYVGVVSDLSAIRMAAEEKKKLEEQLTLAQRMESVARLAGGVAHDFNNLLTIILSHAGFIESDLKEGDPLREDARRICEAGERATLLTRQLLAFSSRQIIKPEVLDLNDAVRSMEKMLRRLIGEDIDLGVNLAPNLGQIEADLSQLEQVILNLAVNARDAMPNGGRLVIETRNTVVDRDQAEAHAPMHPGRFTMLIITDTGTGMDEQVRTRAFDPFFTTKERDKGTGLGLATVYGIVKKANGFIWIYSEPDKGTTFKIYWPWVDRPLTPRVPAAGQKNAGGRGESVLVVEDEILVRKLAGRILKRTGYRVVEAANGGEALLLAEKCDEPIDLLLTDVIMPNMNGRELAKRLLKLRPSMKVLFTSGYADDVIAYHGVLDRGVTLIEKPYSAGELTSAVRTVLDGTAPGGIGKTD
jgi:PAS domain S-box-containing protein